MRRILIRIVGISVVALACLPLTSLRAAQAPEKQYPPRPGQAWGGYNYPRALDAEIADADVHRVLFEDEHIQFLEVSNPPNLDVHLHGHPFASVFAHDSETGPKRADAPAMPEGGYDTKLDKSSAMNGQGWGNGPAPKGAKWPTCNTSPPQAPHRPYNAYVAPFHFYRLEFVRLDGDDIQKHWREWYPTAAQPGPAVPDLKPGPALGANFSAEWPYPIAYDSVRAAPNNYRLLYEDGKMRLLEVVIRPGETTPMHGHPYSSVLAFNAISGPAGDISETKLDPASPLNGQNAGYGAPPSVLDMKVPTCSTMGPQAPHKIHNAGATPLHYYRMEFKRVDGDAFLTNWRTWYPWMLYMPFMR